MYDIPEDCLLTYDPDYLDFHSDSTDFQDTQVQKVTNKNGNHSLISKSNKKSSKQSKYFVLVNPFMYKANISSVKISKNSSKEMWESETIYSQDGKEVGERKRYVNKKCKISLDSGDQLDTVRSKRSLIRHKVIPCISGMFKRSCNNKHMSAIDESNKDDACQTFRVNYEPKMRQLNRTEQCYVTQPVHEPDRKVHPISQAKASHRPLLTHKIQRSEYTNAQYSLTSSSEADRLTTSVKKKDRTWKSKNLIEHEVAQVHVDNTAKLKTIPDKMLRKIPSKRRRKFPFQVYANPCQTGNPVKGSSDFGSTTSAVPSSCSGFWDYLFNKINTKYQTPRPDFFKPCDCRRYVTKKNSPKACSANPYSVYSYAPVPCPPGTCVPELCIPELCAPNSQEPESLDDSGIFGDTCPTPPSANCQPGTKDGRSLRNPCKKCPCKNLPQFKSNTCEQRSPDPRCKKQAVSPRPIPSPRMLPQNRTDSPKQSCSPPRQSCSPPRRSCSPPRRNEGNKRTNTKSGQCQPKDAKKSNEKVTCECPSETSGKSQCKDNKDSKNASPCQLPHDCLTRAISQKYNAEVLCIHNPPCVLINGCLNLPQPKPEPTCQTTMWPIVECHRASFQHVFRNKSPKQFSEQSCQYQAVEQACQYQPSELSQYKFLEQSCQYQVIEQSCQYQAPSTGQYQITDHSCQYYPDTVNAYQVTDHRKEKIIQSSCNHKPPCEVKRICHRPKYDPKLQTSCVHVPMCENIPLCVLESSSMENGQSKRTCRHKPKCAEVPVCRRNYYMDIPKPANEEVGTQVRPRSKMICRHVPPCLMLPRCLERLCDEACCQFGAIPDCVHQPMCEMIPACCRKPTKEMVSVCSQHPNSCRIV